MFTWRENEVVKIAIKNIICTGSTRAFERVIEHLKSIFSCIHYIPFNMPSGKSIIKHPMT